MKYCLTMGYSKIESRKSDVDVLVYAQHWLADLKLAAEIRWTLDEPVQEVSADVVHRNKDASFDDSAFERAALRNRKLNLVVGK